MSLTDLLPLITGAGGGFVALIIGIYLLSTGKYIPEKTHDTIVADKDKQITDLNQAVLRERERAEAAVIAAQTTRDLLQALHREAGKGR
jgi:hypothetical protein